MIGQVSTPAWQTQRWRRRRFIVKPKFQYRFMLSLTFMMVAGFTIMYAGNYYYLSAVHEMGRDLHLDPGHPYFEFIAAQRLLLNKVYLAICGLFLVTLLSFALLLSHRIAGPLYRISNYIDEVIAAKEGERLSPLRLRQKDYFPELAESLNQLLVECGKLPDSSLQHSPDLKAKEPDKPVDD